MYRFCFPQAVRVGFEPTVRKNPYIGFQDQLHRPLGHLTLAEGTGVEPVDRVKRYGLANHPLNRSGYPPIWQIFSYIPQKCQLT